MPSQTAPRPSTVVFVRCVFCGCWFVLGFGFAFGLILNKGLGFCFCFHNVFLCLLLISVLG